MPKFSHFDYWNVHTLYPGMNSKESMTHKTAELDRELVQLKIDICVLSETRLAGMGSIPEEDYTIVWCGKANGLYQCALIYLKVLHDTSAKMVIGPISIIGVYTMTLMASDDLKDSFYEN